MKASPEALQRNKAYTVFPSICAGLFQPDLHLKPVHIKPDLYRLAVNNPLIKEQAYCLCTHQPPAFPAVDSLSLKVRGNTEPPVAAMPYLAAA